MKSCCKFWHDMRIKRLENNNARNFELNTHLAEAKFCPECAGNLNAHTVCNHCMGLNNVNLSICTRCGSALNG